jgi:hypothetical protein
MPLESVPLSRLPRQKLLSELTDDEMGRFCDYLNCLTLNGYGHSAFFDGAKLHPRSPPILGGGFSVYLSMPYDKGGNEPTRADCAQLNRQTWGACHVGVWEDWVREAQWVPPQAALWVLQSPAYRTMIQECGF